MNHTDFAALGLADPLLAAIAARGHSTPTPIQARAIPELLTGRDLIGIAQTGTGKTAAYTLPILQRLGADGGPAQRPPRALILAPTRELALQIGAEVDAYGRGLGLRHAVIFGGVSQRGQVALLRRGVDIVVATPGRLLDLMGQGRIELGCITMLVLDEADRMLDMGFVRDVRRITAALPEGRQSLLFSATMERAVARLAGELLREPVRIEVTPQATPAARIAQGVHHVAQPAKAALLVRVLADPTLARVIVFTRTKHRANRVAQQLLRDGIAAEAIHGNKSQGARQRALERFRAGQARVLVATDIAARGIDVEAVTHVVNFELPNEPESYVHRIGRTARAGASGAAISFCDAAERDHLRAIERLLGRPLTVLGDGHVEVPPGGAAPRSPSPGATAGEPPRRRRNRRRHAGRAGGRAGGHAAARAAAPAAL